MEFGRHDSLRSYCPTRTCGFESRLPHQHLRLRFLWPKGHGGSNPSFRIQMFPSARKLANFLVFPGFCVVAKPGIPGYRGLEMQSIRVLAVDDFASFRKCGCAMFARSAVSCRRASCRCIGRRSESPGGTLTVAVINMFRVLGQAADGLDAVQKARGGTSAVAAINLR